MLFRSSLSTCPGESPAGRPQPCTSGSSAPPQIPISVLADEGTVLCGDEEGNVWIYDVRPLVAQRPPPPAAPQAPTQVGTRSAVPAGAGAARGPRQEAGAQRPLSPLQILKWPQPRALGQTVSRTMVNMVVADPTFTYLTALTDSNIVAIWRRNRP